MKWFKHDTHMCNDLKVQHLIELHGLEGYAVWNLCLEMVGREGSNGRLDVKTRWLQGLSKVEPRLPEDKLKSILSSMADLGLICPKAFKFSNLYIPKFMKWADDYTRKKQREMYGQDTDNVPANKKRIDKKRIDIALSTFRDCHKDKFHVDYMVANVRDRVILCNILSTLTDEEVKGLIIRFFESNDEFVQKAGYTIPIFKSQINKLRTAKKPECYDGRWKGAL